ncbi:MAG: hypothetical protein ABR600_00055 [Actinomycetota bacterium]
MRTNRIAGVRATLGGFVLAGAIVATTAVGPASAATSATIDSLSRTGTLITVSGTASFVDQPSLAVGTDGTGDTFAPGQDALGGDLTGVSISTKTANKVTLSWAVTQLPAGTNGAPTGVMYGWDFCVNGANCFEVDAQRAGLVAQNTSGYGILWRCADPACTPANQAVVTETIPVTFGTPANTVTATFNFSQINVSSGSVITPVLVATDGAAFTGLGDASAQTYLYNDVDAGVPDIEDYVVAGRTVDFAVAAPGSDPSTLSFGHQVAASPAGAFTGTVDVSGLAAGTYTLFARACFGSNNCGYASQDITV